MPYRMHSQYSLLLLKNDLAEGRFEVGDRSIGLANIRYPMLVVATERDHVSPWRAPPLPDRRSKDGEPCVEPDAWLANHEPRDGSWWPAGSGWLAARSASWRRRSTRQPVLWRSRMGPAAMPS
jgi:polyhydroxyalkanoate synthase subunit PhaC